MNIFKNFTRESAHVCSLVARNAAIPSRARALFTLENICVTKLKRERILYFDGHHSANVAVRIDDEQLSTTDRRPIRGDNVVAGVDAQYNCNGSGESNEGFRGACFRVREVL